MTIVAAALIAGAVLLWLPSARATRMRHLHAGRDFPESDPRRLWERWRRKGTVEPDLVMAHSLRALAAELRAGSTPAKALENSAGDPSCWPRAVVAGHFGEPIDVGLQRDAQENPDHRRLLLQLAACWKVGAAHGSGLAATVERLALSARMQHELQSTLRGELATSRATTRLLALLPVLGVAMGYLLGADPIGWFLGSTVGLVLLLTAVALTGLGVWWTRRIVRRIELAL